MTEPKKLAPGDVGLENYWCTTCGCNYESIDLLGRHRIQCHKRLMTQAPVGGIIGPVDPTEKTVGLVKKIVGPVDKAGSIGDKTVSDDVDKAVSLVEVTVGHAEDTVAPSKVNALSTKLPTVQEVSELGKNQCELHLIHFTPRELRGIYREGLRTKMPLLCLRCRTWYRRKSQFDRHMQQSCRSDCFSNHGEE